MLVIYGDGDPCISIWSAKKSPHLNVGYLWWLAPTPERLSTERSLHLNTEHEPKIKWCIGGTHAWMFKHRKVTIPECWNWTKDKVMCWKGHQTSMLLHESTVCIFTRHDFCYVFSKSMLDFRLQDFSIDVSQRILRFMFSQNFVSMNL